jgi:hypothetical protein
VEIELVSAADFLDNQQLLPSTQPLPDLRQRKSPDKVTQQGSAFAKARADVPSKHFKDQAAQQPLPIVSATVTPPAVHKPAATVPWMPTMVMRQPAMQKQIVRPNDRPLLEEVAPPEMVELVNNEGDHSLDLWQAGGRSTGGSGAPSNLMEYLKELNRKIKAAWNPPRGETRRAEIYFRIGKSGQLLLVKVIKTSADPKSDQAAIQAVSQSAPFKRLPHDYLPDYIDVQYDFNYNVDRLSEINQVPLR